MPPVRPRDGRRRRAAELLSVQEWGDGVAKHKDVIAKFFGGATIEEIGRQFARIDANNDEKLSWDEMLAAAGITDA